MTEQQASELLKKYKDGLCTPQELAFMESWYKDLEDSLPDLPYADSDTSVQRVWQMALAKQVIPQKSIKWFYWPTAAAACVLAIVGAFYFSSTYKSKPIAVPLAKVEDAPAGSNRATLTLANGQQIALDAAQAGTLAQQAGVTIAKNASGQLVYTISPPSSQGDSDTRSGGIAYNTISTPKGGQYEVYLPDGSYVVLNAASSLKYPIKFNPNERRVVLTGEGYFEISKKLNQPFIVSSGGQTAKVLGTHFNITSYQDEPTITTLAEGKIEITSVSPSQTTILKPGQQATLSPSGKDAKGREGSFSIKQVNAEDALAWKDGLFVFNDTDLKDVLRTLARWYNVDVDYKTIPDMKFYGEIPRKVSLLKVLAQIAAVSDVQLKLQEGRIMQK
jgi:transmembrane sensor